MTPEYNLRYLKAGLEELERYLLSKEIYWPIGAAPPSGRSSYPQLTLGNLLLALKRAKALVSAPNERSELNRLANQLEAFRTNWRVAWGNKAQAEFGARLTLWRNFLEDYRRQPQAHYDRYAYEVNRRVLLEMLLSEAESITQAESELLTGLDKILQSLIISGDFIWESTLALSFPSEAYWYLYGRLPQE